jgi:hypothetical protein
MAPGTEMLKEDVTRTVEPYNEGFCEFSRRNPGFPLADLGAARPQIPGPAQIGKAAHPTTQRQEAVPKEDSSLDKVGEACKDVVGSLYCHLLASSHSKWKLRLRRALGGTHEKTTIGNETGHHGDVAEEEDQSIQHIVHEFDDAQSFG